MYLNHKTHLFTRVFEPQNTCVFFYWVVCVLSLVFQLLCMLCTHVSPCNMHVCTCTYIHVNTSVHVKHVKAYQILNLHKNFKTLPPTRYPYKYPAKLLRLQPYCKHIINTYIIHIHTYIHTYIHNIIYIHIYIHTYIYICMD